jgi:hypothetical protein
VAPSGNETNTEKKKTMFKAYIHVFLVIIIAITSESMYFGIQFAPFSSVNVNIYMLSYVESTG